jgi:4-hydroxybenzoate polyprenyltransferase
VNLTLAALRIVAAVVIYRLRKLEMANLAAAVSIAVALRLPWPEVAYRAAFAFLLNALVYLNNDYIDVGIDLRSADKDRDNARFLAAHLKAALAAQLSMVVVLAAAAILIEPGLLIALVAGGGICWWYSARLKRVPYWDVVAMMIWGCAMPLLGSPVEHVLGWALAIQLGLFSGVFESIQVIRDADDDASQGVRTTAVALGKERTLTLARALMVASTVYLFLAVHPAAALISAAALLMPCNMERVVQYWTRVKLVYGAAWLFVCASIFFSGGSGGYLWAVQPTRTLGLEAPAAEVGLRVANE